MNWESITNFLTKPFVTLGKTPISVTTLIGFVLMVVAVVILARWTRWLLDKRLLKRTNLDPGLQQAIARIVSYLVLLLGVMIGLQTIGIELTSLHVLAGALGVGLGFGLRNVVENFVSGLIILGERPIQVGDRIEVGKYAGKVLEVGARSTTIRTNDNVIVIVPNSDFIKDKVINWSHHRDPKMRVRLPVGVGTDSDLRKVEKLLLDVARDNKHVLQDPAPSVRLIRFGDNAHELELRVWTEDIIGHPTKLKSELYFAIWDKFREENIELPFPQRDLRVRGPVQVEMETPEEEEERPEREEGKQGEKQSTALTH